MVDGLVSHRGTGGGEEQGADLTSILQSERNAHSGFTQNASWAAGLPAKQHVLPVSALRWTGAAQVNPEIPVSCSNTAVFALILKHYFTLRGGGCVWPDD